MALTERLQILIESVGSGKLVGEFKAIGATGKAEFDKVGIATERLEVAQLRAAHSAAALERAQLKVGATAPGTLAAARAAEALEAAELKAAHAANAVATAQARVAAATAAANQSTGIAGAAMSRLAVSGATAGTVLGASVSTGAVAAGAAVGLFALKGVRDFAALAEEIDSVQDVMGGTAEEASKLRFAAVALGVPIDTVAQGVFKLSSSLAKNKDALAAYGVEAVKGADGNTDLYATLGSLSDAYNSLSDPVERNRLLLAAFGRGGRDLEEVMSAGGGRLRQFAADAERAGMVMDQAGVKKGKEFGIAMRELGQSIDGLAISLGGPLVKNLTDAANGIAYLVDKANAGTRAVGGIGGIVGGIVKNLPGIGPLVSLLGAVADGHGSAADEADEHAAATHRLADASEDAVKAADKVADARSKLVDISVEAVDRTSATVSAEENLAEAHQRLADVQTQAAEDGAKAKETYAAKVVSANERVADAEARLGEAQQSAAEKAADAETRLADAQEAASERIVAAQRSAQEANESAHESTRDAERALSDLRRDQGAAGNPALAATINRGQATQRAVEAVDKARERERDTATKGAESVAKAQVDGARTVASAQDALDRARVEGAKSVEAAERQVIAARVEQNKVAAEGVEVDKRILAGQRQIETATQAVGRAQDELARAKRADALAEAREQAEIIVLQREAAGLEVTQLDRNRILAEQYDIQAAKLDANSPLRKNLRDWSAELRGLKLVIDTAETEKRLRTIFGLTEATAKLAVGIFGDKALDSSAAIRRDTGLLPGRASGGPTLAGHSYIVGEQGREILTMGSTDGFVHPNARAAEFAAAFRGDSQGIDYDRLATAIVRAQRTNPIGEPSNTFVFHGVQPGDLPSQLPREMRKQRYLSGYGR